MCVLPSLGSKSQVLVNTLLVHFSRAIIAETMPENYSGLIGIRPGKWWHAGGINICDEVAGLPVSIRQSF